MIIGPALAAGRISRRPVARAGSLSIQPVRDAQQMRLVPKYCMPHVVCLVSHMPARHMAAHFEQWSIMAFMREHVSSGKAANEQLSAQCDLACICAAAGSIHCMGKYGHRVELRT